ncbi:PBSX family phage terminase large subunit [Actinomadura violacea]|uniref:PBSX family phage terminase large subunit n=1 Tax=Actinomadura violacea TaxID=2819934 RepID=A0ABS3RYR0_9ACTN|nr:PBSX family phage terminase large subunit [Actinomadura violacea]MBO2461169.1 PBSX family phage terminase large subunit [Actinomadura violacea]
MPPAVDLERVTSVMSRKQIRSIVESERVKISLWEGAVSSGKTIASLVAFLIAVAQAPENGLIFCVGRTLQTVERNIIEVLMQPLGPFGPLAKYVEHTRGSNVATIFGRTVHLVGASDVRAEGRIRGATASLIYIDEATLIPEGFWTMCLSRIRVPGARLIATTNPDGPSHWLRKKFLLREGRLNLRSWHFVLDDNPFLEESFKQDLRNEYVGLWYRRFIQGEWCLAEGSVYDMWDEDRHIVSALPEIVMWPACGIDYGTSNPFSAEMVGLGADGRLYLTNEWRYEAKVTRRQLTDPEYSARLRDWAAHIRVPGLSARGVQPRYWVVDPSAASFITQLYRDKVTPTLADNAVLDGIRLVSSLLATDRLRVHESCTGWIEEVPGYTWDPDQAEKGIDEPVKTDDHSLDAGRYGLKTTEFLWRPHLALAA